MAAGDGIRFGVVPDPLGSGRPTLAYRATQRDAQTAGGIRTETLHPTLPRSSNFWQVARLRFDDWSGTTDNQIVFQWHDGWNASESWVLKPILAFYVVGDRLSIALNYDTASYPGGSGIKTVNVFQEENTPAGQWWDIVVNARIDPFGNGYLRIWRNGQQIVDYAGPLGFDEPNNEDYAKIGYYHWTNAGNAWDPRIPDRTVYVQHMSIVGDPSGQYRWADLQGYLQRNS